MIEDLETICDLVFLQNGIDMRPKEFSSFYQLGFLLYLLPKPANLGGSRSSVLRVISPFILEIQCTKKI